MRGAKNDALAEHHAEVERIQHVYSRYDSNPLEQAKRDPRNEGNRYIASERRARVHELLHGEHLLPLNGRKILDVGCGSGSLLRSLVEWGAGVDGLIGVDLLPDRLSKAQALLPGARLLQAAIQAAPFQDSTFDIVCAFTLMSSVLSTTVRAEIAREITRILKPGGAIVFYDIRYPSPGNSNVRAITQRELEALFPAFEAHGSTLTLLPPLARRLGRFSRLVYPALAKVPPLRSHYLAILRRR